VVYSLYTLGGVYPRVVYGPIP